MGLEEMVNGSLPGPAQALPSAGDGRSRGKRKSESKRTFGREESGVLESQRRKEWKARVSEMWGEEKW